MNLTDENFQYYFDSNIKPLLEDIEVIRVKARKLFIQAVIGVAIMVITGAAGSSGYIDEYESILMPILIGSSIYAGIFSWFFYQANEKLREEYKSKVLNRIIQTFKKSNHHEDDHYDFFPKGFISEATFKSSGLFHQKIYRYEGEDLIKGRRHGVPFEFSEIKAIEMREKTHIVETVDVNGEETTEFRTTREEKKFFEGIFFRAHFNKPISKKTFVLPDVAEANFGNIIGNMIQRSNFVQEGDLVKLENIEFEKRFVVYSEDQVESRFILTPLMMERIMGICADDFKRIYISFLDQEVNIALETKYNFFEPKISKSLYDAEELKDTYETLAFFITFIDELELNQHLWGDTTKKASA